MKISADRAQQLWKNNAKMFEALDKWRKEMEYATQTKIAPSRIVIEIEKLMEIQQEGLFDEA